VNGSPQQFDALRRLGVTSEELDLRALRAAVRGALDEGLPILQKLDSGYILSERGSDPAKWTSVCSGTDARFASIRFQASWPEPPNEYRPKDEPVVIRIRPRYASESKRGESYTAGTVASHPSHFLGLQVYRKPLWAGGYRYAHRRQAPPTHPRLMRSFKRRKDGTFNWQRIHEVVAKQAQGLALQRANTAAHVKQTVKSLKEGNARIAASLKAAGVKFRLYQGEEFRLGEGIEHGASDVDLSFVVYDGMVKVTCDSFRVDPESAGSTAKALLDAIGSRND